MKTLYESILDDEDILISDVKKDANNPFLMLYNYYISNGNEITSGKRKDIADILKYLELPFRSTLTAFNINIISPKVYSITDGHNRALCHIGIDGGINVSKEIMDIKGYKVLIFFNSEGWGRKGMNYYIKSWVKKYDLKHASKNIYYLQ